MPHPFPLASVFSGGMRRDVDRTEIPGGSAYNMVDFIPDEIQAVTGGRGGWTYAGPALTSALSAIRELGYNDDASKLIATDSVSFWDAVAGGAALGTPTTTIGSYAPPAYHRSYLFYGATDDPGDASHQPAYYKGDGTFGVLAGAPRGMIPAVYKDHSVLAKGIGDYGDTYPPNRIWFSDAGDPTTWDTTFGWWDTSGVITGVATLLNTLLVFHNDSTERLRGTTPPPGSDMTLEPFLPSVGCIDAHSIAYWQNNAIWASPNGIYMSNGSSSVDLTANAQMKSYWNSIVSDFVTGYRISGGVYRDHYILTVNNGTTLIDCLCVSLTSQAMWRFSNVRGRCFFNLQTGRQEKLYMGLSYANRVAELSSLWSPSSSVKYDGDGTSPTPIVETGMFRGFDRLHRRWIESMGKQKWRYSYVDYDLRDSASDDPTMTLSWCTTPTGSYTDADRAIPATTDIARVRRSLSPTQGGATHSQMLGLKLAVNGPYASAELLTIEGAFEPIEIGAL